MLEAITPDRLEQVRRAMGEDTPKAPQKLANARTADLLAGGYQLMEWGGRQYRVHPVPYRLGVRLRALLQETMELDDEQVGASRSGEVVSRICGEAIPLFRRCVLPHHWLRRLLWPLTPNPFSDASEREVGQLLAFFSMCRMTSRARLPSDAVSVQPQ